MGPLPTSAFDYPLPAGRIAQVPVEPRQSARLLDATGDRPRHRHVEDLPDLLGPGDVLVLNETRVLPARLRLQKASGGRVEILLLEPLDEADRWAALVRPGRRVPPGTALLADAQEPVVEVQEHLAEGLRAVRLLSPTAMGEHGEVPLPPYITRPLEDPERYQTVYARRPGSVAAPTAGLHLTNELLDRCRDRGAAVATVDLAVGLATFRPIETEAVDDHPMHAERFSVPAATVDACAAAERVVAVGTTVVRALEAQAAGDADGGRTTLFIRPGFPFRVVDLLLTNFHLPRSSLLVLLAAFCGERWRDLYEVALDEGYRFLSFGDAMLVPRQRS